MNEHYIIGPLVSYAVTALQWWQHMTYTRSPAQHRELISPLLQPHLQQALDSPTTTSRPFLSALRRASSTSSEIGERAERLNAAATDASFNVCSLHTWDSAGACLPISWGMELVFHGSKASSPIESDQKHIGKSLNNTVRHNTAHCGKKKCFYSVSYTPTCVS